MQSDDRTGLPYIDLVVSFFHRLTSLMSVAGTAGILTIMCLISADVFGRAFLGKPIAGVPEMVSLLILSIVFLQLANTLMHGRLTRADGFLLLLRSKSPRAAGVLDGFMHLVGAGLVAVLVNAFYPLFLRSYARNEMVGNLGQFQAPLWPTYLIVLIGAAMLVVAFLLKATTIFARVVKTSSPAEVNQ